MAKQFTVRLKNEPGALARLAAKLGEHGIDIRMVGAGAVGPSGFVVLSTNNDSAASEVLRKARYTFVEGEVLHVALEDKPGGLAELTGRLAAAGVNISGVMLLGRHQGKAEMGFTVDQPDVARRAIATQLQRE
jgi:hypothetical protein